MSMYSFRRYCYIVGRSCSNQKIHTRLYLNENKKKKKLLLGVPVKEGLRRKMFRPFISIKIPFRVSLCLTLEFPDTGTLAETIV